MFSAPMVRAILDGKKTQTRRVAKVPVDTERIARFALMPPRGKEAHEYRPLLDGSMGSPLRCRYGTPGDRLWVRETFASFRGSSVPCKPSEATYVVFPDGTQVYRDGQRFDGLPSYAPGAFDYIKWRPSIHLPRWGTRILLDVRDVCVEQLQEITELDARAEGVERCGGFMSTSSRWTNYGPDGPSASTARESFMTLWDSINGETAPWASDPWVWRVEFERVQP